MMQKYYNEKGFLHTDLKALKFKDKKTVYQFNGENIILYD